MPRNWPPRTLPIGQGGFPRDDAQYEELGGRASPGTCGKPECQHRPSAGRVEMRRPAVLNNAASIIVIHQHPSGDPTPSREDIEVTKRLSEAAKILGIELLDHVIVTHLGNHVSLKEKGYL